MTCSAPGCSRPRAKREWCNAHYIRWRRYGDPLGGRLRLNRNLGLEEREVFAHFMAGSPPAEGCWDWTAATAASGYGVFGMVVGGKPQTIYAHRTSYELFNGPTEGRWVLHQCDRPICCQPLHLHLGDHDLNMRERDERARTLAGEQQPMAKLTNDQVSWIRQQTSITDQAIADQLGISRATVGQVRRGESWKHLL